VKPVSRRQFLKSGSTALAAAAVSGIAPSLMGEALGLPIGLQLYSVREQLPTDFDGTLKQIGSLGYREVEAAGYFGHSAADVKQAMKAAGLNCVSGHYPLAQLQPEKLDSVISYAKELGLQYIVCSSPMLKDPSRVKAGSFSHAMDAMTLDDWRWNAEQFNQLGTKVKAAGMQFGYHNHVAEFHPEDGVLPYDELLRLTDPSKVTMEMDCGWVVVAGQDPVDYLHRYPNRISMLHVKEFKFGASGSKEEPVATEMGRGSIDYIPILKAAKAAHIRHYFIEQEQFTIPPMEALKMDADYMRAVKV
jgi:sugar phosphate isomerase/epimerase